MNYDLSHLGFDEREAREADRGRQGGSRPADGADRNWNRCSRNRSRWIEGCDRVVLQFSGGKDSTVALNWVRGVCEKFKKPLTALFVETEASCHAS